MAPRLCTHQGSLRCLLVLLVSLALSASQSANAHTMDTDIATKRANAQFGSLVTTFARRHNQRSRLLVSTFAAKKKSPPPPKKKSPPPPKKHAPPPPPPKSKATSITINWDTRTTKKAATKTVYAGSTVTWLWGNDFAYHSVQDADTKRNAFNGTGGGSTVVTYPFMYSHRFLKPGTFKYHCYIHTSLMTGAITVLK